MKTTSLLHRLPKPQVALLILAMARAGAALADVEVTNLDDNGPGSLRDALMQVAPGGVIRFASHATGAIHVVQGPLVIDKPLALIGPGSDKLTVDAGLRSRVFTVIAGPSSISGLTLSGGYAPQGGGILSRAALDLSACVVRECVAPGTPGNTGTGLGGGIDAVDVRINDCLFQDCRAEIRGGGAQVRMARLERCTFLRCGATYDPAIGESAPQGSAGGVYGDDVSLSECRFESCWAEGLGGGASLARASLTRCSFLNGRSNAGGGLECRQDVFVTNTAFLGNEGNGGGIRFTGSGTVSASRIDGGVADDLGSAIAVLSNATALVEACSLSGNHEASAISVEPGGRLTVVNTTCSANESTSVLRVGANGVAELLNCTIAGNTPASWSSAIDTHPDGSTTLRNVIVADNRDADGVPRDASGSLQSLGHNLIGSINGSDGWTMADLAGIAMAPLDPRLEPLADYGGPTPSMRPLPGSPALDAGDDNVLSGPSMIETDQRGGHRRAGDHVDIGATEAGSTLRIVGVRVSGQGVGMEIDLGTDGPFRYRLESKDSFNPETPWATVLGSDRLGGSAVISVSDPRPLISGGRFYRAAMRF